MKSRARIQLCFRRLNFFFAHFTRIFWNMLHTLDRAEMRNFP